MMHKVPDRIDSLGMRGICAVVCALIVASHVWPSLFEERAVQWNFQSVVYKGSDILTCIVICYASNHVKLVGRLGPSRDLDFAQACLGISVQLKHVLTLNRTSTSVQWPVKIDVDKLSDWHCDDADSLVPMISRVRVIGPYIRMLSLSRYCVPFAPPGEGHAVYVAEFHPGQSCIGATFSMNIEPNFAEGAFNTDASSLDQFESACGNYLDAVQDYVIQVTATSTEETTSDVPGSTCGDSYSDEHWKVNTTLDPPPSLRASNWSPSQQSRESVKRFLTYEFHGNRRVMNRTCIQHRLAVLVEKNESLCIMGDSHTRVLYYAAIEHLLGITKERQKLHSDQLDTPPIVHIWMGRYDGQRLAPVATCAKLYVSFAHWYLMTPRPVTHPVLPRAYAEIVRDALRYLRKDFVPPGGKIFWGLAYAVRGYPFEYFKGFLTCPPTAYYNDALLASYNRYSSTVATALGIPAVDGFSITQPVPELQVDTIHYSEPATGALVHLVMSHLYPECFSAGP